MAGDPEKSFLYLKVAGFGAAGQVGGRMPFGKPPLSSDQIALLADWIRQGAHGPAGQLPPRSTAPLPGEPAEPSLPLATTPNGTGTITGTVVDQARKPIAGALVTLLLRGPGQEGGEEHYKVAETDASRSLHACEGAERHVRAEGLRAAHHLHVPLRLAASRRHRVDRFRPGHPAS